MVFTEGIEEFEGGEVFDVAEACGFEGGGDGCLLGGVFDDGGGAQGGEDFFGGVTRGLGWGRWGRGGGGWGWFLFLSGG